MTAAGLDRNHLRRSIFVAARQAGLDAETRRALQERVTGKSSLADMSAEEMSRLLAEMRGNQMRGAGDSLPSVSLSSAVTALWISAYHLGVVSDRRQSALCAFIRRQTGVEAARFATPVQMARVLEALKGWMASEAGVDWSPYRLDCARTKYIPAARVLEALWRQGGEDEGLSDWVRRRAGADVDYTALRRDILNRLIAELAMERGKQK